MAATGRLYGTTGFIYRDDFFILILNAMSAANGGKNPPFSGSASRGLSASEEGILHCVQNDARNLPSEWRAYFEAFGMAC